MKWFVVLAVLVGYGEGGALKCLSAEQGSPCRKNLSEKKSPIQIAQDKPAQSSRPAQSALPDCEPGSEWISNCHSCKCSQDGVAKCERMAQCDKAYGEPIRCKPGTHVERDCNHCTCLDNGMLRCTLLFCDNLPILKPSEGKECKPGTNFKSECNDCTCGENGIAACTQVACPKEGNESPKRCAPGSRWSDDCNNCWCTKNGDPICTQRTCIKEPEVEAKSNSSKNIDVPSNDTTVSSRTGEDNKKNATTLLRKTREVNNKNEQAKNCIPNQEFRLDCNKCLCDTTGQNYSCTRMDCTQQNNNNHQEARTKRETESAPETPDIAKSDATKDKPESSPLNVTSIADTEDTTGSPMSDPNFRCNPGEQFKRGCNDCSCSADGKSFFCTLRLCDQDITPPPS